MGQAYTLLLFISLFVLNKGRAQPAYYELSAHYNSENGLPQNSITGMLTDKNNFIWLGTQMGLARFDGRNMKTFLLSDISPLARNRIAGMAKLGEDSILVDDDGLGRQEVKVLIKEGNIHILPRLKNLDYFPAEKIYRHTRNKWPLIFSETIGDIYRLYNNDSTVQEGYFFNYDSTITYFNGSYKRNTGVHVSMPAYSVGVMRKHAFQTKSCFYTFDNSMSLTGFQKGQLFNKINGTFSRLLERLSAGEKMRCTFWQRDSMVLFVVDNKIYHITEVEQGIVDAELLTDKAGIPNKTDLLYLPEKDLLLIGTHNTGLYVFRKRNFQSLAFDIDFDVQKLLGSAPDKKAAQNTFYAVQPLNDHALLTDWGILNTSGASSRNTITNFDRILPKTTNGYILYKRSEDNRIVVADSNLRFITFLEDRYEYSIGEAYCNDKDTFYIMANGTIRKFLFGQGRVDKLEEFNFPEEKRYWCMLKSTADSVWMAMDGGLLVMNVNTKKYRTISELKGFDVRTLYADAKGTIWIGTYGKGWYKYEQGRGLIEMPVDRLRNLTNVHAFIEDKRGYIWMSTNNGLFRFLKSDLDKVNKNTDYIYYNYFTKEYGFRTNEFNGGCSPSVVRMNDGRFVFPTINGLVLFHPEDIPVEIPDFLLLTDDITVDGEFLNSTEDIVLKPSFTNLSLKLSIPYYGHHYNLQVQYRLSGGGDTWTRLNDDGMISFNRLVHGDYILSVRILSGYGSRGFVYKEIKFTVERFWYQTWWFSGLIIMLIAGIVIILVRRRIRNIQKQQVLLEAEVIKRTEDLKQSEEKVKQNARFKSQVTSLVLHDVRSPLYYLNKITGSIYHSSEGQVPETFREQLKDLHLSVKDISAYAQTLFVWVNAQQDDFVLKATPVKLFDVFEEICGNYHLLAGQNNNSIGHNVDGQLTVVTQADLLQIVLRNLVDNAIKFTKNGKITLSAEVKEAGVSITVSDTGKGMAQDRIELIVSKEGDSAVDTRSGMGYRLIKDLLKKMAGKLEVTSKPGEGTVVTIILLSKKK